MTKLTMKSTTAHTSKVGAVWYLRPAFWLAIAVGGLLYLSRSPETPQGFSAAMASAAPIADTQSGVPAASTVFNTRYWDVFEYVQQF